MKNETIELIKAQIDRRIMLHERNMIVAKDEAAKNHHDGRAKEAQAILDLITYNEKIAEGQVLFCPFCGSIIVAKLEESAYNYECRICYHKWKDK